MSTDLPLVTVLTPVYNGEKYLAECIESVLAQTYQNWEYVIVNNCSEDKTLEIAQKYANRDSRIKLVSNHHFVSSIENHNIAFRLISEQSKYCKVVSADDWITPECLDKMVKIAEAHPSVGIVGSYQLCGDGVRWKGLPDDVECISGREVCRLTFLDGLDVFGNPTSCLYRSELIRKNNPFYPHLMPHADTSAAYRYLQYCDFGFVHEAISMGRIHEAQVSSRGRKLGMGNLASLEHVLKYGPIYLTEEEFEIVNDKSFKEYYRWLGGCVLKLNGKEFWKYHTSAMRELGCPISWINVMKGAIDEIADEIRHPWGAFHKVLGVLKEKYYDLLKTES